MDSYLEAVKRSIPPGMPLPLAPGHPALGGLPPPNHAALASLYGPGVAAEMVARERERQTLEREYDVTTSPFSFTAVTRLVSGLPGGPAAAAAAAAAEQVLQAERLAAERSQAERLALADPLLRFPPPPLGSGGPSIPTSLPLPPGPGGPGPQQHTHTHSHTHLHLHPSSVGE